MPMHKTPPTPRYRRQTRKPHDRAFVELDGRRIYLGVWNSEESHQRYNQVLAEWLSNGRHLPVDVHEITVVELCAHYWEHAKEYYRRPDGTPTSSVGKCRMVIRLLKELYGTVPAVKFGPLALKAVRQTMVDADWSRGVVNHMIGWIRRIFRWGVAQELIPVETSSALTTIDPLRRGRSKAREGVAVLPVADDRIEAIKPFVSGQVWAMIQLQRLSGPRPGEIVGLRGIDINTNGEVWRFSPAQHKTSYREHDRTLFFGPRAQAILKPFLLDRPLDRPLFSPIEAEARRRAAKHTQRKTSMSAGNTPGSNRSVKPLRQPNDHYTTSSYERAIIRACDQAFPPPSHLSRYKVKGKRGHRLESETEQRARLGQELWAELQAWYKAHRWHPNQLRHGCGTYLRQEFGIDVAQTILGHRMGSAITEVYAESNVKKALDAIREVG